MMVSYYVQVTTLCLVYLCNAQKTYFFSFLLDMFPQNCYKCDVACLGEAVLLLNSFLFEYVEYIKCTIMRNNGNIQDDSKKLLFFDLTVLRAY